MGKVFEALTKSVPARNQKSAEARVATAPQGSRPAPTSPSRSDRGTKDGSKGQMLVRKEKAVDRIGAFDDKLLTLNESFSPVAESFRRLRTRLLHPSTGDIPRSILVTSVAPNEGKGFVAANLAITLAQSVEQHAVLIDCDLRRPSLAGQFGLSNERGVSNHLQEGTDLSFLIKPTGIPKLSIIPAGPPPINPSELLDSGKMAQMMDELMNRYRDRFVIFDSPPMQAASETAVLAKHVDGVVLVVRWGGAGREQVKRLTEMIGKKKIVGVVFNGVQINELESKLYRYRGYYGSEIAGYQP